MMKRLIYCLACLSFSIVIGGAVYEHLAIVPRWAAAPPASLAMFQGVYGINPGIFWMIIHPLTFILFVLTLSVNWRSQSRTNLLFSFSGYLFVLLITSFYFVPELLSITETPYSVSVDPELIRRARLWEVLSLIRLGFLIILAMVMFMGLTSLSKILSPGRKNKIAEPLVASETI